MSVDMRWNAVLHTPFISGSSPGGQTSSYNGSVEERMFQRQVTEQIVPAVYASIGSASTLTSAGSSKLLCKMVDQLTAKVVTDATFHFVSGEQTSWFNDGPLPVYPMRLNAIKPRTLDR